jgi:hypothetical protein
VAHTGTNENQDEKRSPHVTVKNSWESRQSLNSLNFLIGQSSCTAEIQCEQPTSVPPDSADVSWMNAFNGVLFVFPINSVEIVGGMVSTTGFMGRSNGQDV